MRLTFNALTISSLIVLTVYCQERCPVVDCEDKDGVLTEKGACFVAQKTNTGKIDKFIIGSCPNDNPQTKENCGITAGNYVWINTAL